MSGYSVKVTVYTQRGTTYTLGPLDGDDIPGNVAAAYGLADPLTITQKLSEDSRLPLSHPEPDEATFQLIAPDNTTYQDLAMGDQVAVYLWPAKAQVGTPVTFFGRVAALSSQPHDLGVLLSVSCVDYTADLAELPVGLVAYPVEAAAARLNRITDEAGLPRFTVVRPAGFTTMPNNVMAARSAGQADAYSALRELLYASAFVSSFDEAGTAFAGTHSPTLVGVLSPNITADLLDPTTPFTIRYASPVARRVAYAPPLRIVNTAGVYGVKADTAYGSAASGTPVIAASRVTFAPAFTQLKGGGLANVSVGANAQGTRYVWDWRAVRDNWATGGATWGIGGWNPYYSQLGTLTAPQVVQELESIMDASWDADGSLIVQHYRVPYATEGLAAWAVGTLTWQLWAEPAVWRRPQLSELLTVAGAVAGKLPNVREWVSGLVKATTLKVENGRPTLDVDLAPPSYDFVANREQLGSSLGVVSMDSPILTGVTLAQLKARDTLNDYTMVRGT